MTKTKKGSIKSRHKIKKLFIWNISFVVSSNSKFMRIGNCSMILRCMKIELNITGLVTWTIAVVTRRRQAALD